MTTNLDDGTVTILLGDGKGGFRNAPGSPFPAGAKPWQVAIDDVDGDGKADLLVIPYERDIADPSQNALTILRGDGIGGFKPMAGSRCRSRDATDRTASRQAIFMAMDGRTLLSRVRKAGIC